MPVDITTMNTQLMRCVDCPELWDEKDDAIPGYGHSCKLLHDSAFNLIPDEIIEVRGVLPECPKLNGTINEGTRCKVYHSIATEN